MCEDTNPWDTSATFKILFAQASINILSNNNSTSLSGKPCIVDQLLMQNDILTTTMPSTIYTTSTISSYYNDNTTPQTTTITNLSDQIEAEEHAPIYTTVAMIKVSVLSVMAIISLIGNIATILNININWIKKRMKNQRRTSWSAIYLLIFHLSIADLLVTIFCIFGEAMWTYTVEWIAGSAACKIIKFLQMFSLYLSTFVLVLIGIDRWVAIKYPLKSLRMAGRCIRLLLIVYLFSMVLSIPQLIIFDVSKGPFIEDFHQCVTYDFYTAYWQEQLYTTFTLLFMFLIPLIILILTYVATYRAIAEKINLALASRIENEHIFPMKRLIKKKSTDIEGGGNHSSSGGSGNGTDKITAVGSKKYSNDETDSSAATLLTTENTTTTTVTITPMAAPSASKTSQQSNSNSGSHNSHLNADQIINSNGMEYGQSIKRHELLLRAKIKSQQMSVAIILAFLICWSPYYLMMLTFMFLNPDRKLSDDLQSVIFFFGMTNSLVNPVIYGFFHLRPSSVALKARQKQQQQQHQQHQQHQQQNQNHYHHHHYHHNHHHHHHQHTASSFINCSSVISTRPVIMQPSPPQQQKQQQRPTKGEYIELSQI